MENLKKMEIKYKYGLVVEFTAYKGEIMKERTLTNIAALRLTHKS